MTTFKTNDRSDEGRRTHFKIALFLTSLALWGILTVIYLARIPGEGGGIFGYSLQRIALMAVALLPSMGFIAGAVMIYRERGARLASSLFHLVDLPWLQVLSGLLALFGLGTLALPAYWFNQYAAYYERVQPLLVWAGALGLQVFILTTLRRGTHFPAVWRSIREQRSLWRAAGITLSVWVLLWGAASLTGVGIQADSFWNEAGVPILGLQVVLSLIITLILNGLAQKIGPRRWVEVFLVLLLWSLAVFLWMREPLMRTYFTPGPYPPEAQIYPYSDAAYYDIGGQYVLLGKVINNNYWVDKPLYMLFLGLLRALAGQSYERTMLLQVLVLALQPVLIYLLGREMHSRAGGLLAALLVIFQERNALVAAPYIQVSHVRLMLTESLTALLLIWLGLLLFRWWRHQPPAWQGALLAGSVLGVVVLVRPNPILIAPLIVLAVLFLFKRKINRGLWVSLVFLVGILLPVLPWSVVSAQQTGQVYLLNKINQVINTRYRSTPTPTLQPVLTPQPTAEPIKPDASLLPPKWGILAESKPVQFIPAHFIHNQMMSALVLPHTLVLQDVSHTLQEPYWLKIKAWDGRLPFEQGLLVLLNLALFSLGVGSAWQRWKLAGLSPLILEIGYHLANALGRTSGGRYLVPVDWMILLYYAFGVVLAISWLWQLGTSRNFLVFSENEKVNGWKTSGTLVAVLGCALIGALIPLSGSLFPEKYIEKDAQQTATDLMAWDQQNEMFQLPWNSDDMQNFIQSGGRVIEGSVLYPRFYGINDGEPDSQATSQLGVRPYPRMTFTLLTGRGTYVVLLPNDKPLKIADGQNVTFLGCWNKAGSFLDAAAVVVIGGDWQEIYLRNPSRPFVCPMPETVCDNNRVCR